MIAKRKTPRRVYVVISSFQSKGKHVSSFGPCPTVQEVSNWTTNTGFSTKFLVLCKPLGTRHLFQGPMKTWKEKPCCRKAHGFYHIFKGSCDPEDIKKHYSKKVNLLKKEFHIGNIMINIFHPRKQHTYFREI